MSVHAQTRPQLPELRSRRMIDTIRGVLSRYSIDILRASLGLVFLGFGWLKFIPMPARPRRSPSAPSTLSRSA